MYHQKKGNRHDFDEWAERGAYGWSYKEVLPYFIRAEDNQDPDIAYNGYHGRGGPLTVQRSKTISPLSYTFVEAGKLFGKYNRSKIFKKQDLFKPIDIKTRNNV